MEITLPSSATNSSYWWRRDSGTQATSLTARFSLRMEEEAPVGKGKAHRGKTRRDNQREEENAAEGGSHLLRFSCVRKCSASLPMLLARKSSASRYAMRLIVRIDTLVRLTMSCQPAWPTRCSCSLT